jgi:hypothetical protein
MESRSYKRSLKKELLFTRRVYMSSKRIIHGVLGGLVGGLFFGAGFAVVFHRFSTRITRGLRYGLLYGGFWWLLGPLTLMPLLMGMGLGVNWNAAAAAAMLPSLVGHLVYGAVLGISYSWLQAREQYHRRLATATVTKGR